MKRMLEVLGWWLTPWQYHETELHKPDHYRHDLYDALRAIAEAVVNVGRHLGEALLPVFETMASVLAGIAQTIMPVLSNIYEAAVDAGLVDPDGSISQEALRQLELYGWPDDKA